jgi:hypothetical protein
MCDHLCFGQQALDGYMFIGLTHALPPRRDGTVPSASTTTAALLIIELHGPSSYGERLTRSSALSALSPLKLYPRGPTISKVTVCQISRSRVERGNTST